MALDGLLGRFQQTAGSTFLGQSLANPAVEGAAQPYLLGTCTSHTSGSLLTAPNGLVPTAPKTAAWRHYTPMTFSFAKSALGGRNFNLLRLHELVSGWHSASKDFSPPEHAASRSTVQSEIAKSFIHPNDGHRDTHSLASKAICGSIVAAASRDPSSTWQQCGLLQHAAAHVHDDDEDADWAAAIQLSDMKPYDMLNHAALLCSAVLSGSPTALASTLGSIPAHATLSGECVLTQAQAGTSCPWLSHLHIGAGPYHALCLLPWGPAAQRCLELLRAADVPLTAVDDHGYTVTAWAAHTGCIAVLCAALGLHEQQVHSSDGKAPILAHPAVNAVVHRAGCTPLMLAVMSEHVDAVRILLVAGADPWWHMKHEPVGGSLARPCRVGVGPLAWSAAVGGTCAGMFPLLLDAALSALHQWAAEEGTRDAAAGSEPGGQLSGAAAADAVAGGELEQQQILVASICSCFVLDCQRQRNRGFQLPDSTDTATHSLLGLAFGSGQAAFVRALLSAVPPSDWVARMETAGISMQRLLIQAVRQGRVAVLHEALSAGLHRHLPDTDNLLMAAVDNGDLRMTQRLVDAGVPLNTQNGTCPMLAGCLQRDDVRMAKLLLAAGAVPLTGNADNTFPRPFFKYLCLKASTCDSVLAAWISRMDSLNVPRTGKTPPLPNADVLRVLLAVVPPASVHASQLPLGLTQACMNAYVWSDLPAPAKVPQARGPRWHGSALLKADHKLCRLLERLERKVGEFSMVSAETVPSPAYIGCIPEGHPLHLHSLQRLLRPSEPNSATKATGSVFQHTVFGMTTVACLTGIVRQAVQWRHPDILAKVFSQPAATDTQALKAMEDVCQTTGSGILDAACLLLSLGGFLEQLLCLLAALRRTHRGLKYAGNVPSVAEVHVIAAPEPPHTMGLVAPHLVQGGIPRGDLNVRPGWTPFTPSAPRIRWGNPGPQQGQGAPQTEDPFAAFGQLNASGWGQGGVSEGSRGAAGWVCKGGDDTLSHTDAADQLHSVARIDSTTPSPLEEKHCLLLAPWVLAGHALAVCRIAGAVGLPGSCIPAGALLQAMLQLECSGPAMARGCALMMQGGLLEGGVPSAHAAPVRLLAPDLQSAAMTHTLQSHGAFAAGGTPVWAMGLHGDCGLQGAMRGLARLGVRGGAVMEAKWHTVVGNRAWEDYNWSLRELLVYSRSQRQAVRRGGGGEPTPPTSGSAPEEKGHNRDTMPPPARRHPVLSREGSECSL